MSGGCRVRFAPSPTGYLHVGNARTALFNWLFARHHGGTFLLRIEDTDRERTSTAYEKEILESLKWLALEWDEGPDRGGALGPYRQSERMERYAPWLERLLGDGRAYPCYCTDEELEAERTSLLARREAPRYLGRCRDLGPGERLRMEREGRRPAYRFRVEEGTVEFRDLIRGPVRFDGRSVGDFIIVRSNGIPAYNFAVVIDDHFMEVSHVIRGEDHLSNTALQLMLYASLGWEPPSFAHHSLILGEDRSKLGKRHGSVSVREFRERGFLPEALVNYLALLGSSLEGGREICPPEEMVSRFSLERAGKSGAVFDGEKLRWMNGVYLRQVSPERLLEAATPFLEGAGCDPRALDRERVLAVLDALRFNVETLADAVPFLPVFFSPSVSFDPEAAALLKKEESKEVVGAFAGLLSRDGKRPYGEWAGGASKQTGKRGKALFLPLRAALTGRLSGPELDRVYDLLPPEILELRMAEALRT